jgi:hypothetical protein
MTERIINISEHFNKKDLELILEVNRKAIEIETEVANQNEEIISRLDDSQKREEELDAKMDKLIKHSEEANKDLFRIQVLFVTGLLGLIIQIIQIFAHK